MIAMTDEAFAIDFQSLVAGDTSRNRLIGGGGGDRASLLYMYTVHAHV